MSSPCPLHRLATQRFDEHYKCKQSESFLSQLEHTIWVSRHRISRAQYLQLVLFLWKQYIILASYKNLCRFANFLFIYSFTPLLFRHLPTEIINLINVYYQVKCFSGDTFSFLGPGFANIYLLFWLHVKFKQGFQRH